ncbi:hypothetical protein FA13DRAFT_1723984, partial [Coprinellus micaceus]
NPAAYDSLFASYPALRLSLQPSLAGVLVPSAPAAGSVDPLMSDNSSSVSDLQLLDLKPLRERAFLKSVDPNSSLCRYEFPGAGVCRDPSCQDVHPNKLKEGVAPTGTSYPSPYSVGVLISTLSQPRPFLLSFHLSVTFHRSRYSRVHLQSHRRVRFRHHFEGPPRGDSQQSYCKP